MSNGTSHAVFLPMLFLKIVSNSKMHDSNRVKAPDILRCAEIS